MRPSKAIGALKRALEQHTLLLLERCESPGWNSGLCGPDCNGNLYGARKSKMRSVHT